MSTFLYLLLTLLLLSIMVVIHEFGHFIFAKLFKVTVLEFSIGMGPAIFTTDPKKKKKRQNKVLLDEIQPDNSDIDSKLPENSDLSLDIQSFESNPQQKTIFSIRAFPIGGYVSMAGEDDSSTDANAFCNQAVWKRLIITVAGAVMNILLGILCMFTLVGIQSAQDGYLPSTTIDVFYEESVTNKGDSPLMIGDTILRVDGVRVHTGNELVYEIMNNGYEPIDIVVLRDGKELTLKGVKFPTVNDSGTVFGNYDFYVKREDATFGNIMKHAVFRSFSSVKIIIDSLKDLVTGRYGAEAVSGPIGMAGAVGDATKQGGSSLLFLFILITMNLGVFNLLPLPALDGGRIIFLLVELIIRRPVKKEFEQAVNTIGIMLLMALMLFVTFKDIINLF